MVRNQVVKKKRILSNSPSDRIFDIVNIVINFCLLIIFVFPLWFVVIASFSDPNEIYAGNVIFWIKGFTLTGYKELINYEPIWVGFRNSVFYTVVGTIVNLFMTILCAYPLSRKDWLPRRFWLKFCLITMYFSGGLIPTYLVVKEMHLLDTPWVMIIPGALSFYNVLIVRSYFMNSIPSALQDAAELDGASHPQYLRHVIIPLSKPVLAVVGLYYAVGHWNDYYTALIYIKDKDLFPLQTALHSALGNAQAIADAVAKGNTQMIDDLINSQALAASLRYTTIIVGVLPMMLVYPFVQKHFVKGVMIGAIKG